METRRLDVAVVGAGTAGLYAFARALKNSGDALLFDGGPLGTTCARIGCMPSKAFLHVAARAHLLRGPQPGGVPGAPPFTVDTARTMARVREKRDALAGRAAENALARYNQKIIRENARFAAPMVLEAGGAFYEAKSIVLATGSVPVLPPGWRLVPQKIVTTDSFFDLPSLPETALVVGAGPVGMELGQGMSRLGVRTTVAELTDRVCGIGDPEIRTVFLQSLAREGMDIRTGTSAELQNMDNSVRVALTDMATGAREDREFGMVLVAAGRRPNVAGLGLEKSGLSLDRRGMPVFDSRTLRCENRDVYIAGDASGLRPFYHDAAEQGMLAGVNAAGGEDTLFPAVPLSIVFTSPQVAQAGARLEELAQDSVVFGSADPSKTGRGFLEDAPAGLLRLCFEARGAHRLLGAEMACAHAEHLAHFLAAMCHARAGIGDVLRHPFYHPSYEELVQSAALDARARIQP
jgi:dihydrolipoamide dehydrogenase